MKSENKDMNKASWLQRLKVAVAAFAFVGATLAGGVAIADTSPVEQDNQEVLEEARLATSINVKNIGHRGMASGIAWH